MADIESNIHLNVDTSEALANIKALQSQISAFHQSMSKGGAAVNAQLSNIQQNLINQINATGKFQASIKSVTTTTESFTNSLEKNKFSMGQYFKYGASQVTGFRKVFSTEFDTIEKVARERVKTLQTQYVKLGRDASGAMQAIQVRPLKLDMEDLGTQTAIAAQKQQIFNQILKQGSTNLLNFGKNTQWAGRQLMVGFTIPISIFGATAGREFMKIEEQVIRLQRVYGDFSTTAAQTDEMTQSIKNLAGEFTKYGVAVEKTIGLAADAAAMGKTGADLISQVAEANKLAVLGGVDQAQALDTTVSLTNAFGVATDKLAGKVNFLNAVENQTVTSIQDLTEAIPTAGPVIQQLGGDVEDLAFFLTAMREGGINASEGANALKSGLASMINPTKEAVDMLNSFNINVEAIRDNNAGNVAGMVTELATSLNKLDPLNRAQAIETMFGKFQFARMSTLFQNVVAEGSQAARVLDLTRSSAAELAVLSERELKKVSESPMYKFQKAIEDFKAALAPVGETFIKAVTPLIEFGTKILDGFNGWSDQAKQFSAIFIGIFAGIGPVLLMTFGLVANGIANIIKGFASVSGFLRKTAGDSNELGQQTQYMTMEQLQAASVAASLDQVHQTLIQTFTSEASAVRDLASAYSQAIAMQGQLRPGPSVPGKGGKVSKFAKGGVVMVPGSGNGDTVPAMLTPGEAVIPKDMVKQYGPLIQGMIAGKVAGYAGGGIVDTVTAAAPPRSQKSVQAFMEKQMANVLAVGSDELVSAFESFITESVKNMKTVTESALKEALRSNEALTSQFNKNLVQQGKTQFAHIGELKEQTASELLSLQQSGKVNITHGTSLRNLQDLAAVAPNQVIRPRSGFGMDISGEVNNKLGSWRGSGAPAQDLMGAMAQGGTAKWAKAVNIGGGDFASLEGQIKDFDAKLTSALKGAMDGGVKYFYDTEDLINKAENKAVAAGQKFDRSSVAAVETITKTVLSGLTGVSDELIHTFQVAEATITELRVDTNQAGRAALQNASPGLPSRLSMGSNKRTTGNLANATSAAGRKLGGFGTGDAATIGAEIVNNITKDIVDSAKKTAKIASPSKLTNEIGEQTVKGYSTALENGIDDVAKVAEKTSQAQAHAATLGADELGPLAPGQTREKTRSKITPGKVAGAAGAAAGVAMMASQIPGKVGETASQLIGPLMAVSMVLPMLSSASGAAVIALGALVGAIMWAKMSFDAAQDSSMKMTEALNGGEKAIRGFAEFAGNVTAGEIMDKRRQENKTSLAIATGENTFGESYVQTDAGKSLVSNAGKGIKQSGAEQTASQIASQLATTVASGALSASQAKSIAANLGMELGSYDFGIKVNGELDTLIGSNGENLLKDPLQVRVNLLDQTRQKLNTAGGKGLSDAAAISGTDVLSQAGGIAAGAGAGAAAGALAGSVIPLLGTAVGAVVGTAVGAISGGILGSIQRSDKIAKATGANVAMNKVALQQQQEMIDSLDMEYEKRIATAQAAGNMERVDQLTNEHLTARNTLLEKSRTLMQDIANNFAKQNGEVQGALTSGVMKSIDNQFKGTAMEDVAAQAKGKIVDANLSQQQEFVLLTKLDSGDIDPIAMSNILDTFTTGEDLNKVLNLTMKMDSAAFDQAMYLTNKFDNETSQKNFVTKLDVMANDKAVSPQEIQDYINTFSEISKLENVMDVSATMDLLVNNQQQFDSYKAKLDAINKMPDITVATIAEVSGMDGVAALTSQVEGFDALPAVIKKELVTTITTINAGAGTKEMKDQYKNAKSAGFKGDYKQYQVELAKKVENDKIKARNQAKLDAYDQAVASDSGSGGGGGGSVQKVATLDNLLKKLRDVRDATTAMTNGWNESRLSLDSLFGNGMSGFNGLQQQMRNLGAGEDLITLIAGMDPEEYNRRKDELFVFDANGNIAQLRQSLGSIGAAMRAIAMGDFQDKQQKTVNTIKDQSIAVTKLVAAGMSYSQAYEAVQDTAYASAVANEKNNQVIKDSIKYANEAAKAQRNLAAAQAVASSNEGLVDQGKLYQFLADNASKLTDAQTQAILGNKDLQTLALSPQFDPNTFQDALDNVSKQSELDLKIKKLTITGMEEIFNDGFQKAMDAFSAKEQEINLQFKTKKDPFNDIIEKAQQSISDIQNAPGGLDDLDADIERISRSEEEVNKKYDERLKALDEIQKAQQDALKQSKSQLTIADALSQGDLAAAARAAKEMNAEQAAAQLADQRALLQKSREAEIGAITGKMGLTREQIENRIKDLKQQIFDIEEGMLEPAQRRVELLDREEQAAINSLTVLGKSKTEWETIKNNIDVARVNSDSYTKAITEAESVVASILNYWNEIDGKQVSVDVVTRNTTVDNNQPAMAENIAPAAEAVTGGGSSGGGGVAAPQLEQELNVDPSLTAPVEGTKAPEQPDWLTDIQSQGWYTSLVAIGSVMLDELNKVGVWWNEEGPGKFIQDTFTNIGIWWDEGPGKFLNEAFTNVSTWWNEGPGKTINDMMNSIKTWWDEGPGKFFSEAFTNIGKWWDEKIVQPIKGFFDWFFGPATVEQKKKDVAKFVEDVKANFKKWTDDVAAFFRDLPGKIGSWLSGVGNNIGTIIRDAINTMFNKMRGVDILGWKPFAGLPRLAEGGQIPGTGNKDTYPAMLMPGEYVVTKDMVNKYGVGMFDAINSGTFNVDNLTSPSFNISDASKLGVSSEKQKDYSGSVYNNTYSINVSVKSDANPNEIARTVMAQIKQVDAQRIRGNRF